MSESGAWQEVRGNDEDEKVGIEIPPRGTLFFTRELVPMNGVRRGAMWACVAVDPSGNSHYGESVVDREGVPRKWRRGLEGSVGLKDNGGEKMVMEPGIFVENTHLSLADLKGISGGMTLAGRIEKEFGARWLHPYNTRMENRTGEPVRVVWMQAYRWCEEGAWRGDNVMGRVLGPADFNRWFGGDDGSGGQWMQHGSAAQCDFNWTIGDETLVRWECRGVGRSGRVYHGEGEIFLNQPIDLEMLMRC